MTSLTHDFPDKLRGLFQPSRYKVAYGGRGAAKSWSFARALLLIGKEPSILWPGYDDSKGIRVLCFRETMKSIEESVHQVLTDQIALLGLGYFYRTQLKNIVGRNGTEFFFAGVRQSVDNLKSYEAVDIAWGAQSEAISKRSLNVVIPTIRKDIQCGGKTYSSELWFDFNPEFDDDEIYKMFVTGPVPDDAQVVPMNWRDNPWFTGTLLKEMEALRKRDPDECAHVYDGLLRSTIHGAIYKQEVQTAEANRRITSVPWSPNHPVNTYWDLGFGDATTIWFAQSIGFEFRIVDYEAGELNALGHYIKILKEKPYAYGEHWLPWDGAAKELGSGRSIQEQLQEHFGAATVRCAKKLSVEDGIAATRLIFQLCWFDSEKCAAGIRGLRCYKYKYDTDLRTFSRVPLHDWASHPADGFRTLGVAIKEQKKPEKALIPPTGRISYGRGSSGAWME